ncbi:MAG: hypothetical protein PVH11_01200 [Anaerolineae bacterium]
MAHGVWGRLMNEREHGQDPQEAVREASNQLLKVVVWLVVAIGAAMLIALCVLVLTVISWG